jgi:hypothetical protein
MTNERFENPEEDRIEDQQLEQDDAERVKGGTGISRLIAVSTLKADEANQAALQAATKQ